ncbi:MAG: gluconate 2-dehydrogenase subunit 3 family protein [Dehalococcoidia bacterium]
MPRSAPDRSPLSALGLRARDTGVSRRTFLRGAIGLLAGVGGGVLLGCEFDPNDTVITIPDQTWAYAENVPPPPEAVDRNTLGFLTPEEAATIDAFTARLMPGSPEDPGAREADVLTYIDTALTEVDGYWEPTYLAGPFAETYTGSPPPSAGEDGPIYVDESQMDRYGFQSSLTPREIYRRGLPAVDALARQRFGARFVDLGESEQDDVVGAIADDDAPTFDEPSASLFWKTIRQDTVYGMFADPAYGGNHGLVGWKLIGYPGAQRAYTPTDLQTEDDPRPPQSLAELHPFHAGVDVNCDIVLPVSDRYPRNQQVPAERE